jgi:uncharacterized metal-binding protein
MTRAKSKPVLVIPCSGIHKVEGLISREATYLVTDELAPGQTDTLCLGLLVAKDPAALAAVRNQPCITVDGCPKGCAEKDVRLAGGNFATAVRVMDSLKNYQNGTPGTASDLTEDGWAIARDVAENIAEEAMRLQSTEGRQ